MRFFSSDYFEDPKNFRWIHWVTSQHHPLDQYDKANNCYFIRGKLDKNFKINIDVDPDEILEWEYEIRKSIVYVKQVYNK